MKEQLIVQIDYSRINHNIVINFVDNVKMPIQGKRKIFARGVE